MSKIPEGKVPWDLLKTLIENRGFRGNKGIIQNSAPGVDIAAINLPEVYEQVREFYNSDSVPYLIYKSDPITFPTPDPADYLITVNMNDLATCGAIPFGIMVTILLPPSTTSEDLAIFQSRLSRICEKQRISILGGHTEVTSAVKTPVYSVSMIGFVPPEYYIPRTPKPGDKIICSGWVGAEGTGILLSNGKEYFSKVFSRERINHGEMISKKIEISDRILSVNKKWHDSINLVHDVTEGGFYGALYECLYPHSLGCNIDTSKIPLNQVTKEISKLLNINPFKLISSGAVIIVCDENKASEIVAWFMENDEIPVAIVGEVTELGDSLKVNLEELKPPESDHIIKALKNLNSINTHDV
jgi:hydrogenase expression/formation protein HypE